MKKNVQCLLPLITLLLLSLFNAGCTGTPASSTESTPLIATPSIGYAATLRVTDTYVPIPTEGTKVVSIWIDPEIRYHPYLENLAIPDAYLGENKAESNFWIEIEKESNKPTEIIYEDFFVLAVPFVNQTKNVSYENLKKTWMQNSQSQKQILWIYPEDEINFEKIFEGKPGSQVISSIEKPDQCEDDNCWKLINFNHIDPEWRVVTIDNQSPLNSDFDASQYKLIFRVYLNQNENQTEEMSLPIIMERQTNFDPDLLTSVLMTGTTAMVRNTAAQIEQMGADFPSKNLKWLFDTINITHVSNEVSFYSDCPPAIPVRKEMRFCSDPGYIEVLKRMGVDVVELTGNHLLDWGPDAFLETLTIYEENGIQTYGGGRTIEEAEKPLVIEHNGNKIAFLGCNLPGPENNWVSDDRPGSLACHLDELAETISTLREEGINPIFTFQHNEFNTFRATQQMRDDFWQMANAGAVIVSGSQAHYPQGIDFVNSSFIHYGLGNFLFDQMYTYWGMATIDVHYFYGNQYINTHQYPIINENFGQPRLMNEEEAALLLDKIYASSFYYLAENP
ncbi:MAG: CapA family protein [Anaerolineaceae bacterium]|jgi:poly-gamma-glutamate synthesis protein (capsule biosynthesis protein)|nr:CapA family protein [Anaerolineaceae bacterium]